jgi:signal transduction histidine kinase
MGERDWMLSVRDTGMGIPEKSLPHLFQKFDRVRATGDTAPGTGLGLSICKQIVSVHGGSIEVESKPGKGTVFIIHLLKGA